MPLFRRDYVMSNTYLYEVFCCDNTDKKFPPGRYVQEHSIDPVNCFVTSGTLHGTD
jgi:hypothetical protein